MRMLGCFRTRCLDTETWLYESDQPCLLGLIALEIVADLSFKVRSASRTFLFLGPGFEGTEPE